MSARRAPPLALTIAGSDSGGGAGIQADLRTFATHGVHGLCVITAVTAQNTRAVSSIQTLPRRIVKAQLDAVFSDFRVGAIKIGMLATAGIVQTVGAELAVHPKIQVVLDPVLVATTGARLARGNLVQPLRRHLLARADLVTPNIPEAESLLGRRVRNRAEMLAAAIDLAGLGARAVLLKGGHLAGRRVHDLLLDADGAHWFEHARIAGAAHGTGCTLSSAIAARLALGDSLLDAVGKSVDYVHRGLVAGYRPGRGNLRVLDHLAAARTPRKR
ncbi:MAG: bifunctional hydroxymethylpyrimidine kinase/phosphomethylpyrimidine kinase [Rhodanobacteraceae bacterium]